MKSIINQKDKKIKQNSMDKNKSLWSSNILFFILILIFASSVSFFLGKISGIENFHKENIFTENNQTEKTKNKIIKIEKTKNSEQNSGVVASKSGTVYHLPWCSGAVRMSPENKIFFKNIIDAQKAGYRAAKNCEGL